MTTDPTPIADPLAREVAARRAAQARRAERARLGEVDRELGNLCPECGSAGAGGTAAGTHPGWVPVSREIPAEKARTVEPCLVVEWRPCFTCNPDRWQAWQEGKLRSPGRAKVETPQDRAARDQERRTRERSAFA